MEFVSLDLGRRRVDFEPAWQTQREVHAQVVAGERDHTVLLVEHESVFTAGRRTNASDRPTDGSRVIDIDRGGRITWHGPGQLVAYPIVRLAEPIDVVAYVRALEQAVIDLLAELDLHAGRVVGRSGVWFPADPGAAPCADGTIDLAAFGTGRPERKVCAIGVRVARGVTMHGLALNCDADLLDFGRIVPCGISDAGVTSVTRELGTPFTVLDAAAPLQRHLETALAPLLGDVVHTPSSQPVAPGPAAAALS